jgi:predicted ABC-type transport system involved in lysophospholipase L1 biosynthesis ATPase subunit
MRPKVVFADEPTGNLDVATGEGIHELVVELNEEFGTAMILVTHNPLLAERMPRRLRLEDGHIEELPGDRAPGEQGEVPASTGEVAP